MSEQQTQPESDFPAKIGAPAARALLGAGYTRLEQLAGTRAADILKLHGMGPKALGMLRSALAERDMRFVDEARGS